MLDIDPDQDSVNDDTILGVHHEELGDVGEARGIIAGPSTTRHAIKHFEQKVADTEIRFIAVRILGLYCSSDKN